MPSNLDPAAAETDRIIAGMERKIRVEYSQAEKEIKAKLDDYLSRYKTKDQTWRRWVAEGKKTQAEYRQWKMGQIAMGKRWEEMRHTVAMDLLNSSRVARSIVNGYMPEVYAINHNYGTYEVEKGAAVDTSYTLYDRQTVERLMRDNPKMLPDPGRKVSREIAEGKAIRWNNGHIQSVMTQGILQGESIPRLATRLAKTVADSDRKAAIRNARTMATAAQNAGRQDAYTRASGMGIRTKKQWIATVDMRTRHDHRQADLQTVEVEKPFIVGGYEMMYPGDYNAPGREVYNCRCTTRAVIDGVESGSMQYRSDEAIADMTYDEWKASHDERPLPILRPDARRRSNRGEYVAAYRHDDPSIFTY